MRASFAGLSLLLGLLGTFPANAATRACSGLRASYQDPVDVSSQASTVPSGTADLVGWSAEWKADGLAVSWTPRTVPGATLQGTVRYFVFGYAGPFEGGVPYAFLEATGSGGRVTWKRGLGYVYEGVDPRRPSPFVDRWTAPATVPAGQVSTFIPNERLYWMSSYQVAHWEGITADPANDGPRYAAHHAFHGAATAPVAGSGVQVGQGWSLADRAPASRLVGDASSGYTFHVYPGSAGYQPELCRPNSFKPVKKTTTCTASWTTTSKGWYALEVATDGTRAPFDIRLGVSVSGRGGTGLMLGLVSEAGHVQVGAIRNLSPSSTRVAGTGEIATPGIGDGSVAQGATYRHGQGHLPARGRWWLLVASGSPQSVRATFSFAGPGVTCRGTKSGTRAGYVPAESFSNARGVMTTPTGDSSATVLADGRVVVTAERRLLAVLTGLAETKAGVGTLWSKEPAGSMQWGRAFEPAFCGCGDGGRTSILSFGPPGRYEFGYDLAVSAGVSGWEELGLVWADMSLL